MNDRKGRAGKNAPRSGSGSRCGREKAGSDGFRNLQRGLTGERGLVGKSYMDDPGMLAAYLGYYWPASRAQCLAALDRIAFLGDQRAGGGIPRPVETLIDVGSGPGPVAAAFASRGATDLTLLDQSPAALDLARKRLSVPGIFTHACDIRSPDPGRIPRWGEADCVSFGHSLNELWARSPDRISLRAGLLETYAAALAPGGYVLAIEPALLETSRDLIAVRNLLVERGWRVLAPCPGREGLPCPALEAGASHTCHETARWDMPEETARLARSLGLDREWLKMTWFALQPPLPGASAAASDVPSTGPALFRVVSDPMLNKAGRLRKLLCGASGRFPLSAPVLGGDRQQTAFPGFDALERGDFVLVEGPDLRENGWGMGDRTGLSRLFPAIV